MGWLRNLLVFPDDVWEAAAREMGGEFVQGRWLGNSEIKLRHRDNPITLGAGLDDDSERSESTDAVPGVSLKPETKLLLQSRLPGLLGSMTSGLLMRSGKGIDVPPLADDYLVIGDNPELATRVFGHRDFVSALRSISAVTTVVVGCSLGSWMGREAGQGESNFHVSVPNVVKDVHQLTDLVHLTKVLLDLLEENDCLVVD